MCVAATINKFLTLGYEGLQHHYYIFCSCHFSIQHLVLASNTETYSALNCELELNRSKFILTVKFEYLTMDLLSSIPFMWFEVVEL